MNHFEVQTISVDKIRFALAQRISGSFIEDFGLDLAVDRIGSEMQARLTWFMAGKVQPEILEYYEHPETWWDGFKKEHFPKWLLKKYPVKMKRVAIKINETRVCPHLPVNTPFKTDKLHFEFLDVIPHK